MIRRKLQTWLLALAFVASVGGVTTNVALPQVSYAACHDTLLTFPAWFHGLTKKNSCDIESPSEAKGGLTGFILTIAFNIVEILLQAAAYVSVIFIIYGGFRFIVDAGTTDAVVRARKTVLNAIVGLVISIMSIGIVNLIASKV